MGDAKVQVGLKLPPELLGWATSYAESRGTSRQVVIEAAIRSFKRECETGVPDLDAVDTPEVRQQRAKKVDRTPTVEERARLDVLNAISARQQRLNAAKYGRA